MNIDRARGNGERALQKVNAALFREVEEQNLPRTFREQVISGVALSTIGGFKWSEQGARRIAPMVS